VDTNSSMATGLKTPGSLAGVRWRVADTPPHCETPPPASLWAWRGWFVAGLGVCFCLLPEVCLFQGTDSQGERHGAQLEGQNLGGIASP
jgi:hypothetical protein